ncbi:nephrin-like isoform X2 [Haliotis rubra]|uniref:nephrin-like isoform X2 n=1 Tax=Haliotis rubra TaxID=36100 RepID=UPI001EE57FD0|nr:nephrin-like isoform X2 [Haliotis rubra]
MVPTEPLLAFCLLGILTASSAITLTMDRRIAVDDMPLNLTCSLDSSSPSAVEFELNDTVVGTCSLSDENCNSTDPYYSLSTTTETRQVTLTIQPFQELRDYGVWLCRHGWAKIEMPIQMSSGLLQWSSVTTNPTRSDIPRSLTPTSTLTIVLNAPCVKGQANVSWMYVLNGSIGASLTSTYTNTPCEGSNTLTVSNVTVVGNNSAMQDKLVTLRVSVEHDSFNPAKAYTETKDFGPVQFPGAVTSVTLVNITRSNETIQTSDGSSLVLVCETSDSFPTASVSWYKDRTEVTSQSSQRQEGSSVKKKTVSTLTYEVTPANNNDLFSCTANNGLSSVSSQNAKLDVVYSPSRPTLNVSPLNILEGEGVTLTCVSSNHGNPACIYKWKKGEVFDQHQGSTWTFTATKPDNGVKIQCLAENKHTNITSQLMMSQSKTLNVYYRPRVTVTRAITKIEGDTLSLTCSADSNPTAHSYTWTFNSGIVAYTRNYNQANLSRTSQGVYTCTAGVNVNGYGTLEGNATATVTVNYPPDISMRGVTLTEGQTLTLECSASGQPATYTFSPYKQYWGTTWVNSYEGTQAGPKYTLQRASVTYRDSGEYECSVTNGIRSTQRKRVAVMVKAAPVFVKYDSHSLAIGANVTLSWSLFSKPNVTAIRRYFGNQALTYPAHTLTSTSVAMTVHGRIVHDMGYQVQIPLTNVKPSQLGTYTITACNSIDCRNTSLSLSASGPPLVPLEFSAINSSSESVWLKWKPNFPGGNFTQSFLLHYRVSPEGNWTSEPVPQGTGTNIIRRVVGLEPDTEYAFKVQSRNNRRSNNMGPETQEIYQKTIDAGGLGPGVGVGIAVCIGLALLVGAPILVYKFRAHIPSISCPNPLKARSSSDEDTSPPPDKDEAPENVYSGLTHRPGTVQAAYDTIMFQNSPATVQERVYQNVKPAVKPKPVKGQKGKRHNDGNIYENC